MAGRNLHTWLRLDPGGLLLGAVGFAVSLTPSLLPRDWLFQGVAAGLSAGTLYAVGVLLHWMWDVWVFDLVEEPLGKVRKRARRVEGWLARAEGKERLSEDDQERWKFRGEIALAVVLIVGLVIWVSFALRWQRELAALMGAEAYSRAEFLLVVPVGVALWALIIALGKVVLLAVDRLANSPVGKRMHKAPRFIMAWAAVGLVLVFLVDNVVPGTIVGAAERVFSLRNEEIREDLVQPEQPERSGSPSSFNKWEELGAFGTRFTGLGLHKDELEELTGRPSKEPIRVYAGLDNGDDDRQRAESVVKELNRTGARDRQALLVVPTTGTGWVNPTAAQAFELMFDGDTAIASAQYSYLPSAVQFIADQERVERYGEALISTVVDWWNTLPEDARPKLYVYGESLGTTAGSGAFSGLRDLVSTVDGALWVGPPNSNRLWKDLVDRRDPGSPEVSAEYTGGLMVRFAENSEEIWRWRREQDLEGDDAFSAWQQPRVLFVQHPSDPVVWWSPKLLLEEPDWLKEAPGFDRSPSMRWIPFVTFWQVTLDLPRAANVPNGHGHNYGDTVLDGMLAMVGGQDFNPARAEQLKRQLDEAMADQGPEKEVGVDNG
ncbi:MAG TPA: alpha/beta hydrolase [Candidatus Corynebacterium gallistercoris]|uniref:Alpha/beta hydrolase n=1 Tax=Candidatus Corynebacterium gallistercoris TaxID=2838530 RepID=A0A9D1UPY9_9CORY|nr:alpha/beta hydrolase [Candidatus Corynebacterium gallistercoris]